MYSHCLLYTCAHTHTAMRESMQAHTHTRYTLGFAVDGAGTAMLSQAV